MDPNSDENNGKRNDVPECKICFDTQNLMGVPVCECRGTVGNICRKCFLTLLNQPRRLRAHCRDCNKPYRNYCLTYRQREISYNEYMNQTQGLTLGVIAGTFAWESIIIVIFNLLYWFLPIPDTQQGFITAVYLIVMGIFIVMNLEFGREIYQAFSRYWNRPATEVGGVIPVIPRLETVIQIEEPDIPAIDQGYVDNDEDNDIPYMDDPQYFVPIFEAPHPLPSIQKENVGIDIELQDMGPIIPPLFFEPNEQAPTPVLEKEYAPPPIEQGPLSFPHLGYTLFIDEEGEEEETEYQDTYL